MGDPAAYQDLERARARGSRAPVPSAVRGRAYDLAGLAELTVSGGAAARRAARLLANGSADGMSAGRVLVAPDLAALERLGAAGVWVYRRGGRRAGLRLLERYAARGGKRAPVLAALIRARYWWGAPRASLLVMDRARSSLDVCRFALALEDFGCADTIASGAESPTRSAHLVAWARQRFWRDPRVVNAGAWVAMALRAYAAHAADSWLSEIARRVDLKVLGVSGLTAAPGWAVATLLRASGDAAGAQVALDVALVGVEGLTPIQRAVVLAEAVEQGRSLATVERLAQSAGSGPAGLTIAAMHARAMRDAGGEQREARLIARMTVGARTAYLRRHGELGRLAAVDTAYVPRLARWYRIAGRLGLAAARDRLMRRWHARADSSWQRTTRLGLIDPTRVVVGPHKRGDGGLGDIVRAYLRDPARADRLAADYVDRGVAIGERGPHVAQLFVALGDPVRADRWWRRVAESSPRHAPYLMALGASAAAVGDVARARIAFVAAVASAGNPGRVAQRAARVLVEHGRFVAALGLAKRALELTAPADQGELLLLIARASRRLNRAAVAKAALVRFVSRVAPPNRARARAFARTKEPTARWSAPAVPAAPASRGGARDAQLVALLAVACAAPSMQAERALSQLASLLATPKARAAARAEAQALRALRLTPVGVWSR